MTATYQQIKRNVPGFLLSVSNSYSQVFFNNSRIFAVLLMLVTLINWNAGIAGLISVIVSNAAAFVIGFNRFNIKSGYYGFNSLLVGLGLGVFYQPGPEFFVVLIFTAIFTLFITVLMEGVIGKYGLPYLSVPFLISLWMVTLAARSFSTLEVSEGGIFALNEMYSIGGLNMVRVYEWFNNLNLPEPWVIYFRSLGAIFFQYHLFPGLVIAIGILIFSRISFLLSLVGFFSAYYFYQLIGGNLGDLNYSYIGFNFILTAIAVGGFFVIPSWTSFLWVILLTPLISFTITSSSVFFYNLQLSIYSLPFNFIVLLFLYTMKFREKYYRKPELVFAQHHSPEKNLYISQNYLERFDEKAKIPLTLPFFGEWKVTQGYDGEHTHKNEWRHALDFEVEDEHGKTYNGKGNSPEDYYCFGKPVVAPADGWVEEIQDGIADNKVGEMNLRQNWGNTIIIKHSDKLYSKVSHLKKNSVKVAKGAFVKKNTVLAQCGNSGRSPYPHLHFQVQEDPYIGSKTMSYPFAYFISNINKKVRLQSYDIPGKEDLISNVEVNASLKKALKLVPGKEFRFLVKDKQSRQSEKVYWKVEADSMNNTYIHCRNSGAKAYFKADTGILHFIDFTGNRKSLLFYFYLSAYKVIFGYYKGLEIRDVLPPNVFHYPLLGAFQDFLAPFVRIIHARFAMKYAERQSDLMNEKIELNSDVQVSLGNRILKHVFFNLNVLEGRIQTFNIRTKHKEIEARWLQED